MATWSCQPYGVNPPVAVLKKSVKDSFRELLAIPPLFATAGLRLDPLVELGAIDAPPPENLESRNLAGLGHGVDGLLRDLERRDLLEGQALAGYPRSSLLKPLCSTAPRETSAL
jgi:hypothetical protein